MDQNGELIFLGTGTSQGVPVIGCECEVCCSKDPRDNRSRSSVHFSFGGIGLQIDTGPDFRTQMLREGLHQVNAVLFTHEHQDHIAGLDDVRPMIFRTKKAMPLYGQERVINRIKKAFHYAFEEQPYPGAPKFNVHAIDELDTLDIEGIAVHPILVHHGQLPILGYRIGDMAYITDVKTVPEASLVKLQGLKTLVFDALHHYPHQSHCTLEEAVEWAKGIGAENTYFIHLSHHMGTHAQTEDQLPEGMHIAYDGLRLPVKLD
jgi:phosphoribosyl 1,2-cyclic phosphate phosphodiesterase